jgi:hypothetical protein
MEGEQHKGVQRAEGVALEEASLKAWFASSFLHSNKVEVKVGADANGGGGFRYERLNREGWCGEGAGCRRFHPIGVSRSRGDSCVVMREGRQQKGLKKAEGVALKEAMCSK